MPPIRTLWKYYPDKKGLCSGFVLTAFGLSAMCFNAISNKIINPEVKGLEKTGFYPKEVGDKVPEFFFWTFIIALIVGIISSLAIFQYEDHKESQNPELHSELINGYNESGAQDSDDSSKSQEIATKDFDDVPHSIRIALKSRRFLILCIMAFLIVCKNN